MPIESKKLFFLKTKKKYKYTDNKKNNDISGIIVPHAGIDFSGDISFSVYDQLNFDNYDRIIILATHHNTGNYIPETNEYNYDETTFTFNYNEFDKLQTLIKKDVAFNEEHSWIVHLPFLKLANKTTNITIILVGSEYGDELFTKLIEIINNEKTLLVGNTDLLHCGPKYDSICPEQDSINNINKYTIKLIEDLNSEELKYGKMCGIHAIKLFVDIAKLKGWTSNEAFYTTSNKVTSNTKQNINSVGYTSITFTNLFKLDDYNLQNLLTIPRKVFEHNTIRSKLGDKLSNDNFKEIMSELNEQKDLNLDQGYNVSKGIFVTIKNESNQLRGCIGDFNLSHRLGYSIAELTVKSLFYDQRFYNNRIQQDEELKFSVNFLDTPVQYYPKSNFDILYYFKKGYNMMFKNYDQIEAYNSIKDTFIIGTHGITLYFGLVRATYLAKVLIELFNLSEGNKLELTDWRVVKNSLYQKAQIPLDNDITKVELYVCDEYNEPSNIQKGGILYYKINYN